jgi:hypothetical protein
MDERRERKKDGEIKAGRQRSRKPLKNKTARINCNL